MIPAIATPPAIASPAPATSSPGVSERSVLSDRIDQIVADAKARTGGTLGVVVWDLGTNVLVQRNAEQPFPLASVVKLPVAIAAYDAVDRGKMHLESRANARDLIARMVIEGDAAATEMLYHAVGGADGINASLHGTGIDAMLVRTNQTGTGSPAAVALLFSELLKGRVLGNASRMALLDQLAAVSALPAGLRAGLPPKIRLRHKTGTTEPVDGVVDVTNDVGVATVNGRDVILVAMLQGARGTPADREALIADVARAATDATRLFPI